MTVHLAPDGVIELKDACTIEDAETLQRYLLAAPDAIVDWHLCVHAHTAVIQVLLASRAVLRGAPAGEFLRLMVAPLLAPEEVTPQIR